MSDEKRAISEIEDRFIDDKDLLLLQDVGSREHSMIFATQNKVEYRVTSNDMELDMLADITFQSTPVKEGGVNGCFMEDLLHIVKDRLMKLNIGEFVCEENNEALKHIKSAICCIDNRAYRRQKEGKYGTSKP